MPPTPSTPEIDLNGARDAYSKLTAQLADLDPAQLAPVNVDVQSAALVALGVARRVNEPALLARFQALASTGFEPAQVTGLAEVALAAWYAVHELSVIAPTAAYEPKLPADLVKQALELETRMQRCCEYHLQDDPVAGPILDRLRPNTGYRDLASDLLGYSQLEETYASQLAADTKNFRATDAQDAARIGSQILALLGEQASPQVKSARDTVARAWTLLARTYAEVAAAGRYLERKDPHVDQAYPSLVAASRRSRRS